MVAITPKINVLRALSKVVAKKAIFLYLILVSVILTLMFICIGLLTYFFSLWWLLLLIIYIPLVTISAIVYVAARLIAHGIYPAPLSRKQKQHLQEFTDKILYLLETKGMGWWWFATLCVRDLLVYRELRTLKNILLDTTSLKNDFSNLEQELH
jgi:membrane protein implicated in regulation of membrane protease activity